MHIMGYEISRTIQDQVCEFDDLAKPFFKQGGEAGCLVLHGIGGTAANVRIVADALADRGYTVYAPVLPGHGQTVRQLNRSSDKQWLSAVRAGYARLVSSGCTRIYLLGLSLGGILSALLAEEQDTAGLVLISAPIVMKPWLHRARRLSLLFPFVRYDSDKLERIRTQPRYEQMYDGFATRKLRDLNRLTRMLRAGLDRITCPTLILQAKFDNKAEPVSADVFKKGAVHAASIEVVTLENSPHGSTYGPERELAATLCANFVSDLEGARR